MREDSSPACGDYCVLNTALLRTSAVLFFASAELEARVPGALVASQSL